MQLLVYAAFLIAASATSSPTVDKYANWKPPGPGDFRGPCPMLNTLANHGFLPHDGGRKSGITKELMVAAFKQALNFDRNMGEQGFEAGLESNPAPNATVWNLKQLQTHNLLEHDASLSRPDAFFGNSTVFNHTVFDQTRSYWPEPIVNATHLAHAKLARQVDSKLKNPTYTFTQSAETFSRGEVGSLVLAFGNISTVTARRDWVEFWFRNERYPTELGWSAQVQEVTLQDQRDMAEAVAIEASLLTEVPPVSEESCRDQAS